MRFPLRVLRWTNLAEIPVAQRPANPPNSPLQLVEAGHERLRRMSELLVRLSEHLAEHGADERAAVSAQSILDHFRGPWVSHLRDEEEDLFPLLRRRLQGQRRASAQRLVDAIDTLSGQHRTLRTLWKQLEPSLLAVQQRSSALLNGAVVHAFVAAYRAHLELEEDIVSPAYRRYFTDDDLRELAQSMSARRGQASS
jgi:pyridoxamine 5'-phosphate oxidase